MAANGTTGASSSRESVNFDLTAAALAISIAAIVLSSLQALLAYLQFDNSEVGRRRCSEEVMGKLWASKTSSKFKPREFRYQVYFEVPVFYTAPPGITVGPLTKTKPRLTFRDRVRKFRQNSDTQRASQNNKTIQPEAIPLEVIEIHEHVEPIYKITGTETSCRHTLTKFINEDEKWANVHTAEDEGCSWVLLLDALQAQEKASRAWDKASHEGKGHTISYLIQRKRRCWDFMPLNVTKPFATTNICHLVEMMSMLGLVWKEFDMKKEVLSAEGNGYMMKSESVKGLGILARFSRLGKPIHKDNRLIPCDEIKKLCFGEVPSIFDGVKGLNQALLVGSPGRLDACLKRLLPGLNDDHRQFFLKTTEVPIGFPCTFELIALVGKSVHIPGSRFRRLPNPCAEAWTPGLDPGICLSAFAAKVKEHTALGDHDLTSEIRDLFGSTGVDGMSLTQDVEPLSRKIRTYCAAHENLQNENAEKFFCAAGERETRKHEAAQSYDVALLDLLDALHNIMKRIDLMLEGLMGEVREVVASHFATLFDSRAELKKGVAHEAGDLSREKFLVDFYFDKIHSVISQAPTESSSDESIRDSGHSQFSTTSDAATLAGTRFSNERSAVWLALMFRMLSWFFLHDFNPEDRMIERTEFKNNRLPVYIG